MPKRPDTLALLALGSLAACADPPSYQLRWSIEGRDVPGVATCSEVGLFQVDARVFAVPPEGGPTFASDLRSERTHPCHPETFDTDDGTVDGASLPPGAYVVQVRGINRADAYWSDAPTATVGQNTAEFTRCDQPETPDCSPAAPYCVQGRCRDGSEGDPCRDDGQCADPLQCNAVGQCERLTGCDPAADYEQCSEDQRVCDCRRITVTEGDAPVLEFTLDPPGECEDGIDNDLDGRIDDNDASCLVAFGDGTEGLPVGVTEVRVQLSMLGHAPLVNCISDIERIELSVDTPSGPVVLLDERCRLDVPYSTLALLSPGPATFHVRGLRSECDGGACTLVPSTVDATFTDTVLPSGGTIVAAVDFAPADLLQPLEASMQLEFDYRISYGTDANELPEPPRSTCAPPSNGEGGMLEVADLRMTMSNGHGAPLAQPVRLVGAGDLDGVPLDGSVLVPCFGEFTSTEVVDWTQGYTLTVEALSAEGEVCFLREDVPMVPEERAVIELARVYDATGNVRPSCRDCTTDEDCNAESFGEAICIPEGFAGAGTCQYPCYEQSHCQSAGLPDDAGQTCMFELDGAGEPLDFGVCRPDV